MAYSIPVLALLVFAILAAYPIATGTVSAQGTDCGASRVIIEGGEPSPFALPDNAGDTLRVDPQAVLLARSENLPLNSRLRLNLRGIGVTLGREIGPLGTNPVSIKVADYSEHVRGSFRLEGTLLSNQMEICTTSFLAAIGGFGGTVATAATAATAVAGAGAMAGSAYAASGANAKLKLKVKVERRRRRGWRRWVPVPAWKRTIASTIMGAVTGLAGAVILQQAGVTPLSLTTATWGLVVGGGTTFSVGLSLGTLLTFLRPPVEEPE